MLLKDNCLRARLTTLGFSIGTAQHRAKANTDTDTELFFMPSIELYRH